VIACEYVMEPVIVLIVAGKLFDVSDPRLGELTGWRAFVGPLRCLDGWTRQDAYAQVFGVHREGEPLAYLTGIAGRLRLEAAQ
jgi:hypothetical protein